MTYYVDKQQWGISVAKVLNEAKYLDESHVIYVHKKEVKMFVENLIKTSFPEVKAEVILNGG